MSGWKYKVGLSNEEGELIGIPGFPVEVSGTVSLSESQAAIEVQTAQLLIQILTTLKKIEYHLFLGTDTELKDQDV